MRFPPLVLTLALASAPLMAPANSANAADCHAAGYPAGMGCVGLPPEFGMPDASASQIRAWSKCLAGVAATGLAYESIVKVVTEHLLKGATTIGLVAYSTCDLNAIRGR